MQNKNIFLALDTDNFSNGLKIIEQVKDKIAGIKIGLELINSIGPKEIASLDQFNLPVFFDGKFFDVPNQVSKTILALSKFKAIKYLTLHALGSKDMLEAAKQAATQTNIKLLAVSVLTSWDQNDLNNIGIDKKLEDQVKLLVELAVRTQMDGVITSVENIKMIRSITKDLILFCPGIRSNKNNKQDQKRTASYAEFKKIADDKCFAVIGRPIYEGDPRKNIENILQE